MSQLSHCPTGLCFGAGCDWVVDPSCSYCNKKPEMTNDTERAREQLLETVAEFPGEATDKIIALQDKCEQLQRQRESLRENLSLSQYQISAQQAQIRQGEKELAAAREALRKIAALVCPYYDEAPAIAREALGAGEGGGSK